MSKRFYEAFGAINATEEMKQNTCDFMKREISRRQRRRRSPMQYVAVCCTMLALVLAGFGGYSFYSAPVSYISVDVNPSVELGLNRLDRVTTVTAYNDDGAEVLQDLNLKNKPYTEAIELLLADDTFEQYIKDDSLLSFTVVSDKEEELFNGIKQCHGYANANAECHGANQQLVEEAHNNGLSFGKYKAFLELSKYDKTITAEDCKGLSMRQIRYLISKYQGSDDGVNSGGGHNGGGHRHRGGSDEN